MPKLRENKSGNKSQKGKVTNYTISIACSIVEELGLNTSDELTVNIEGEKIIIQKKEENKCS